MGRTDQEMESARIKSFMRLEIARMQKSGVFQKVTQMRWPESRSWCRACAAPADESHACFRPTCNDCRETHERLWHGDA